jgi:hypothetical protein
MLMSGMSSLAAEFLTFIHSHRGLNGSMSPVWNQDFSLIENGNYRSPAKNDKLGVNWSVCHDIWAIKFLEEYTITSGDSKIFDKWWPITRKIFIKVMSRARVDGFIRSCYVGPDWPKQACRKEVNKNKKDGKLTSPLTGTADMGIWYDGLKVITRLAVMKSDIEIERAAQKLITILNHSIYDKCLNRKSGWFYDSIYFSPSGSEEVHYFPALWQKMILQGESFYLFFNDLPCFVKYLKQHQFHPRLVLQNVPATSQRRSPNKTMIHNSWQNFFVETMRLFRWTGESGFIEKYIKLISSDWKSYRLIHENIFDLRSGVFDLKFKWDSLGKWMGMTSSNWWRGLLAGYAGIEWTPLSLSYIPCMASKQIVIKRLPFRGGYCDLKISGKGQWVKTFRQNGKLIKGTWQALAGYKNINLSIQRGTEPPLYPVLVHAPNVALEKVKQSGKKTIWELNGHGQISVVIYSPSEPEFTIDNNAEIISWVKMRGRAFYCLILNIKASKCEFNASL